VNHGFTVGLGCENLMQLDIILPIVIFTIATASVILYQRFEKVIASLFEEKKFTTRDAVLMVVSMGVMVTVIVFIPSQALQIIFIAAYSYMLFTFTYLALKKWFFALLPPAAFVVSYFWFWNLFVFNLFVVVFAILITVYLSSLFSWKTGCDSSLHDGSHGRIGNQDDPAQATCVDNVAHLPRWDAYRSRLR